MRLPAPLMLPEIVRLWPEPKIAALEPVRDNGLPIESVMALPVVVADMMIEALVSESVEPLSVKVAVLPVEPSFVNDIVPSVISPILFVFVVCVVPPKTRLHAPDVVGKVLQFEAVDQLPLPPPPDHVATPTGPAMAGFILPNAAIDTANSIATLRRTWGIYALFGLKIDQKPRM